MYLNFPAKIPEVKGKITYRKRDDSCYVYYEYDRVYDPKRKYTYVKRVMIGSLRLGGVTRGTYRPLKEAEVEMLLKNKNN